MLQQHSPGVQTRTEEAPALIIATLPRADSPSAARYVKEREGATAWTMHLNDAERSFGAEIDLPNEITAQIGQRAHVDHTYDPGARAWDQETPAQAQAAQAAADAAVGADAPGELPPNFRGPSLDE